jgi:hypothetical protein
MICMRCGSTATLEKAKRFVWVPPWVTITIIVCAPLWLVLTLVMMRSAIVYVPLCHRHRNYWLTRTVAGVAFILVVIGFAEFIASRSFNPDPFNVLGRRVDPGPALAIGIISLAALFGIMRGRAIRPVEITDHYISLNGVSEEFIAVLEAERHERLTVPFDYDERFEGSGRRRQANKYYDPDRKRPETDVIREPED